MESLIGLLFWGGVAYYVYRKLFVKEKRKDSSANKKQGSKAKEQTFEDKGNEAEEIAKKVKTHKGLEALQEKIYTLEEKMDDYQFNDNERMYEKTEEKHSIMEMALEYANENPYRYYYCEDPDVDTPIAELKMIGKSISVQKYKTLDAELRGNFWHVSLEEAESLEEADEIVEDNMSVEKDELNDLMAFRKIIESDETEEGKEKKFNKLVSKSVYLMVELDLDKDENISLYEQYKDIQSINEKIQKLDPLPYANFFVDNGYENIEKISALSDEEIRNMEGIGSKRLSEIREYLNGIKILKQEINERVIS